MKNENVLRVFLFQGELPGIIDALPARRLKASLPHERVHAWKGRSEVARIRPRRNLHADRRRKPP